MNPKEMLTNESNADRASGSSISPENASSAILVQEIDRVFDSLLDIESSISADEFAVLYCEKLSTEFSDLTEYLTAHSVDIDELGRHLPPSATTVVGILGDILGSLEYVATTSINPDPRHRDPQDLTRSNQFDCVSSCISTLWSLMEIQQGDSNLENFEMGIIDSSSNPVHEENLALQSGPTVGGETSIQQTKQLINNSGSDDIVSKPRPSYRDPTDMFSHRMPRNREGFEIAILCVESLTISAVESLFDEQWEVKLYGKARGDDNFYKVGRISNCNVVLAYQVAMGKSSTREMAAWLNATFPRISLALLGGICGGVPSRRDGDEILLGDIIISTEIVTLEYGRRLYPNTFDLKDNQESRPSPRIRSFLAKLQAQQTRKVLRENTFNFLLDASRVQSVAFPGPAEDKLYSPHYRHKHRGQECATCARCRSDRDAVCAEALNSSCSMLGCSDEQLIRRDRVENKKSHNEQLSRPAIHFGKIASGDVMMESGLQRDKIAYANDIIAFEIDGVAVWEMFPTIIVKSVCDYADSHKSKNWQKYATYVAAACLQAVIHEWGGTNDGPQFQAATRARNEFSIPPDVLRSAMDTKEQGKPSFWSYKMYIDSSGNGVKVHYSSDIASSEKLALKFVDEPILGFGMQWLVPGESFIPSGEQAIGLTEGFNISIVVLASEDSICIFHLALHTGSSAEEKIAPTLKILLESVTSLKAGVSIFGSKDARLLARFGIRLRGIFELDDLNKVLDDSERLAVGRDPREYHVDLNDLVEKYVCLDYYSGKGIRLSNWGRPQLHDAQISYAASNAYASYQLFRIMDAKRLMLRPIPSLPVPAEQQNREQIIEKRNFLPQLSRRREEDALAANSSFDESPASQPAMDEKLVEEQQSPLKRRRPNLQSADHDFRVPVSIDPDARFVWLKGQPVFNFGKYSNSFLRDVAERDRKYLDWMASEKTDFSLDVRRIARDALSGVFPSPTQTVPSRSAE